MTDNTQLGPGGRPRYSLREAARYLHGLSSSTLRSWVVGRSYPRGEEVAFFEPLIKPADEDGRRLSFLNLVEAYVLQALTQRHEVKVSAVRDALRFAERQYGIRRLLIHEDLCAAPGAVLLERYGDLIRLDKAGQFAMRAVFERHLSRIVHEGQRAIQLFPLLPAAVEDPDARDLVIDPRIAFGRPVLVRSGIRVEAIADRVKAGEDVDFIARDYGIEQAEVERAIIYARAA